MGRRLLLMLVAGVLALLIGEGALSLFLGRSVLDGVRDTPATALREQHDEERFAAAARNPGPYRVHPDPMVGYVLKADAEFEFARAPVQSDTLGLRKRVGASSEDAFRVVVAGDSVAFGQGVANDQTLAHQLEVLLNTVRDESLPPVECRTAALPGWNYRNAIHFVVDHLDELQPDLVLYLPVDNDLDDTDGAYETGHRRNQPDPAADDPWLGVRSNYSYLLTLNARLDAAGTPLDSALAGPAVLNAALSRESESRLADMAAQVKWLGERLAGRDVPLAVLGFWPHELYVQLRARLGDELPVFSLLDELRVEDTLGHDPHPNADTLGAMATWIANELIQRRLVEGDAAALPAVANQFQDRRATPWSVQRSREHLAGQRQSDLAQLRTVVSHQTGEGSRQIYGGINPNGTVQHRLLALLGPGGDVIRVEVSGLKGRDDLAPLPVTVEVGGEVVGQLDVLGTHVTTAEFPCNAPADQPVEVRLIAGHWGVVPIRGTSRVASFQFQSLQRVHADD